MTKSTPIKLQYNCNRNSHNFFCICSNAAQKKAIIPKRDERLISCRSLKKGAKEVRAKFKHKEGGRERAS